MKRWPLLASFLIFVALCASLAYWGMQLFKPPVRPVAAPPQAATPQVRPEAAAALFGGRAVKAAVASNYQLRGVIMSGDPKSSVAIISADGKPAQAVRAGKDILPGVTIKEVHRNYVLLTENGAPKRVELPQYAKGLSVASTAPVPTRPMPPPPPPPPPPPLPSVNMPAPPPVTVVNPNGANNPGMPTMPQTPDAQGMTPGAAVPFQGRGLYNPQGSSGPSSGQSSAGGPGFPPNPGSAPGQTMQAPQQYQQQMPMQPPPMQQPQQMLQGQFPQQRQQ